ncbi:MAG: nucleotidyltransferase domain-containing protein [Thermoleophilia bacterium]|nr:nucleotidyltransferase domain-containing protein [Thermoleophilia bacterium]
MAANQFVSVAQAAELLGVTRQAVLKRIRTGRLQATKVSRNYVVPREAILPSPTAADPVLAEIVRRLVAVYHPESIYLFGSAARGEGGPDSDYDVLLVVPDDASKDRLRARRAYEVLWGIGVAVDVLIWRRGTFDEGATVPTSLPASVLREGVSLYDG